MAFGDCFPTDLINTQDFTVTRPTSTGRWGDDSTTAPAAILGPAPAIAERRNDLLRDIDNREVSALVNAYLPPNTTGAENVQVGDRATWTDVFGTQNELIVLVAEPVSGVDGLEHVRLRLGRRTD